MYKVIIAEDEMFVRLGIKMSVDWEAMGMEVVADVSNGKLALEAYETLKPDIVITDIKMPVMDGMELIRRIREISMETRIVILTCLEEFALVKEAITRGVSDYILKLTMTPEEMEKVLLKVRGELEKLQSVPEAAADRIQAQQEKIFNNFLFYNVYDEQLFSRLPLKPEKLIMAVISPDNFHEICEHLSDTHGSLVIASILNVLHEMLEKFGGGLAIAIEERRFLVAVSLWEESHIYRAEQIFQDWLSRVRKNLYTYFKASVTFGISEVAEGYGCIPKLYEQCNDALAAGFFLGGGRSLHAGALKPDQWRGILMARVKALAKEIYPDENSRRQLENNLESLSHPIDKNGVANFFIHEINIEVNRIIRDSRKRLALIEKYSDMVRRASTLDETAAVFRECIRTLYEGGVGNETLSKTVSDILRYIHSNYARPMTLDAIADSVEMSPNYVCGLFKKEMGTNLMNYIMKFRIEKAANLMLTTHLRSYEIAGMVGFSDESYFSRSFKKMTGVSPNEYRRNVREKDGQ